ncbi:hypothetical protein [Pseudomonas sp. TTU2014-080ASC]|uniref:hypothetical protein n=1 Tax=Pseudomonas sp. TTU2014-080ASC TaxID=1729724 RepID=UPI0007185776|nr:hypothetical protein [Pseudomonas sp. TTU2014-080ASC]KRW58840.1 hypothetical protein AO726_15095 [Pseudomonas sp. TTU2014-080ASC]
MATPHQSKTSAEHATKQIPVSLARDYITVVGASHMTLMEKVRGQKGNKMRFINQGIRQLRQYPAATPSDSVQRIFLIFIDDYERPLLNAVKGIVEKKYGAKYRELDNISQLLDFINLRIRKDREVMQLDMFAHGLVGSIEFGYELSKVDSYRLRDAQARMLQADAFDMKGKIYSYACRTGLGIQADVIVREGEDPKYDQSLAQLIANTTRCSVWAFPRRSNYDGTYGNASDRAQQAKAVEKYKADELANKNYKQRLFAYQRRLAAHRKKLNDPTAQLPNEFAPTPPKTTASDLERTLAKHAISREGYENTINYPLDADGAVRPVRAGDTPTGLPATLLEYSPK